MHGHMCIATALHTTTLLTIIMIIIRDIPGWLFLLAMAVIMILIGPDFTAGLMIIGTQILIMAGVDIR